MDQLSLPIKLILSLIIGAVIGLERESHQKSKDPKKKTPAITLGVRTFSLTAILGAVAGLLRAQYFGLFLTINITFAALLLIYYFLESAATKDHGVTSEMALLYSYLLGVLLALGALPIQIILALTVVLLLILSRKEKIRRLVRGVRESELNAFISYAIIAVVILPFLPKKPYLLTDIPVLQTILTSYGVDLGKLAQIEILNPFKLWFVVALITGVDMLGYVLERTVGQKKGWLLTSIAGGFISSTSTTMSLARQSKQAQFVNLLVAAAIFANLASFFQIFMLIAPLNSALLVKSTPLILSIIISAFLVGFFFLKIKKPTAEQENLLKTKERLKESEIFALGPALKFALIFSLIKVATKVSLALFGRAGFLAASAVASIAGVDAVTLNLTEMAGPIISFQTAVLALILVNATNLVSKTFYSFMQGKREFALKFGLSMGIIIIASFLGLLPFLSP